jgi:hypothetical protein
MTPEAFANELAQWLCIITVYLDWCIRRHNAETERWERELQGHSRKSR